MRSAIEMLAKNGKLRDRHIRTAHTHKGQEIIKKSKPRVLDFSGHKHTRSTYIWTVNNLYETNNRNKKRNEKNMNTIDAPHLKRSLNKKKKSALERTNHSWHDPFACEWPRTIGRAVKLFASTQHNIVHGCTQHTVVERMVPKDVNYCECEPDQCLILITWTTRNTFTALLSAYWWD